jgi:hypothetical protein
MANVKSFTNLGRGRYLKSIKMSINMEKDSVKQTQERMLFVVMRFSEKKCIPESRNKQRRQKLARSSFTSIAQQISPDGIIQHNGQFTVSIA